jgi:protoporphyrinogen/coproporphyrinogen III oxidase
VKARNAVQQVIVVGGGLGGLLVGAELRRRGLDPLVIEAGDRPGGVAHTIREDGYLLEPAAGSLLLPNPDLSPVFDAAGVPIVAAAPEAKTRYVYDRGTLFEVPESPKFLLTRLVSWRAKLRAAREPWIATPPPPGEESVLDFLTRRFGTDVGRLGADLMAHGVFAGDPAKLSMQAAFPRLVALETEADSVVRGGLRRRKTRTKGTPRASVHVPVDGMADVAARLAHYLGDGFVTGRPVQSIRRENGGWTVEWDGGVDSSGAVVVALAPGDAVQLVPEPLAELLVNRPAAEVAVVGLGGPAATLPLPDGFGALAGPSARIRALGILFESSYAPGRAPAGHQLAKGIYGGAADPEMMERPDEEIAAQMQADLEEVLESPVAAAWTRVVRSSIPQYPIGHAAWMRQVDERLDSLPGIHLAGWGYRGIGISALGADAVRIVSAIATGSE